ncbi:UvrD-helicase domain-containing protein [Candidatus Gottesmanbacteria bacterium]|nr:UvrD-helicase domain-containing protein [Candidatus Gottesmanbacteria bacterium]
MTDSYTLNKQQKKAVEFEGKPLLIIAGAGTGKTTVITERIKWLITTEKARASEILALTFTEKASKEMQERVDIAMPYGYTQMWISTFHSFADRVLRDEAIHIGLNPAFKLMTEAESSKLFKDFLFSFNLSYFLPLGNPNKFISAILTHFSRLKDEDVSPNQYINWVKALSVNPPARLAPASPSLGGAKRAGEAGGKVESEEEKVEAEKYLELASAYKKYEELKVKQGLFDFSDLIGNLLILFRTRKNILASYQEKFKYILVDEFQDTNIAQYELIKLLTPKGLKPNLTIVADDNQSIYRFRGAAVSNVLTFKKDYPNAQFIVLNRNYRSTQVILDASYKLIKNNDPDTLEAKLGISKKLKSIRVKKGQGVEFIYTQRVEDEADEVVNKIMNLNKEDKYKWSDFAILVRANNHSEPFIRSLLRKGIPYQFLGPGILFKQNEIKDLISYLKWINDPTDSQSLYRVLTMDIFDIKTVDLALINSYCKRYSLSLYEGLSVLINFWFNNKDLGYYGKYPPFIADETKQKLQNILGIYNRHLDLVAKETAGQILYYFLEDSGLLKSLTGVETERDEQKTQNIAKFFNKLKTYEVDHQDASVRAVVDFIDLAM